MNTENNYHLKVIRLIIYIYTIMTDHIIKNEQWYVKDLISKIDNNLIKKPQYQRKKEMGYYSQKRK